MGYITTYNSSPLSTYGMVTPGARGIHDFPKRQLSKVTLPGSDTPHVTTPHKVRRPVTFDALVVAADHTTLVTYLNAIKAILMPDDAFHPLVVSDRAGQEILALCMGLDVDIAQLPSDASVVQFPLTFEVYPYWRDVADVTLSIEAALLTFRQATFEHSALDGWSSLDTGVPTLETSGAYAGEACMKVVTSGGGDKGAKTPEAGVVGITAGSDYSLQAMLKGAAGGETVTIAVRFFKADDSYISEAIANLTLTATWAQYTLEGQVAPALATKASVQIRDADASTFYVDNVCLEQAATCGAFVTPADANTLIGNTGHYPAYPVYTATVVSAMAGGLTFTVNGLTFTYEGALAPADVLVVDVDPQAPSVKLNGVVDMANTDVDTKFPSLPVGHAVTTLSDASKFSLAVAYRRRYF